MQQSMRLSDLIREVVVNEETHNSKCRESLTATMSSGLDSISALMWYLHKIKPVKILASGEGDYRTSEALILGGKLLTVDGF